MLHGGEPLLVGQHRMLSLIRVLMQHPAPVSYSIQTNGTLLNARWLDFFDEHCPSLDIGISLDGTAAGNAHRVDYRGKLTYDRVVRALDLLASRNRACGVIVVVTKLLLGQADAVVDEMLNHPAIRNVKLSPCLDYKVTSKDHRGISGRQIRALNPYDAVQPGWATAPGEYSQFLQEIFVSWRDKKAYHHFLLEPFVSIVRALSGRPTGFTHFDYRKDPFVVTLYPDGRIGSCDELTMPEALLGTVDAGISVQDLIDQAHDRQYFRKLGMLLRDCEGCRVANICRGGSLPDRVRYEQDTDHTAYCRSRIDIIESVRDLAKRD